MKETKRNPERKFSKAFSEDMPKQQTLERLFRARKKEEEKGKKDSFLKGFEKNIEAKLEKKDKAIKQEAIYAWRSKGFEKNERHPNFYIIFYLILLGIVVYALFVDNLLLAILIILFGLLFHLLEKQGPGNHFFAITKEGIIAEDVLYPFSSLKSFWIFYEPNNTKELSLESERFFFSHINIPLGNANPIEIRKILINFIPEKEQEKTFLDDLEKFF